MAHYAMLRDYRFSEDVDDIRGATVYAADQAKLGKVADVIFDHHSGAIDFLVVHLGHGSKVLVPSDHVFRAVTDEDSFQTDLSSDAAERLPQFEENKLRDERQWREHQEAQRRAWREHEAKLADEYKHKWHEAPVQHRPGSDRNVSPEETPPAGEGQLGERQVTADELFPEPLAGKFPGAAGPMTVPSTNQSAPQIQLKPGSTGAALLPSRRWTGFAQGVRNNLSSIRERCPLCCEGRESRVA